MTKAKGFTLVELIVVIAIIGVLAAILVPAMMGWIAKANLRTANTNAKQIFTNAQTILQECEERKFLAADPAYGDEGTVFSIQKALDYGNFVGGASIGYIYSTNSGVAQNTSAHIVTADNVKLPIAASDTTLTTTFQNQMTKLQASAKDSAWAVSIQVGSGSKVDAGTVRSAIYARSSGTTYVGSFPEVPDNKKGRFNNLQSAMQAADNTFSEQLT